MKKFTAISVAIVLILTCMLAVGCNATVKVFLHNYDGKTTKVRVYDEDAPLPKPTREGYTFGGWYTDEACTKPFVEGTPMNANFHLYAKWTPTGNGDGTTHTTHDFGDSYFMYVKCSYDGCNVYGRNESERKYDNMFTFNAAKRTEVENNLARCQSHLRDNGDINTFITLHAQVEQDLEYVDGQYYWASVYGDYYSSFNYNSIDDVYDNLFSSYCRMFETIDEVYGDSFWNSYDGDREECLKMASLYGDNSNQSAANVILSSYNTLMNSINWDLSGASNSQLTQLNNLYSQYVAANNNIATAASDEYNDYMAYAYKNIYNREYSPEQVDTMRQYVKKYIAPALMKVANKIDSLQQYDSNYGYYYTFSNDANEEFYMGLMEASMFEKSTSSYYASSQLATNLVGEYFKYLQKTVSGGKYIDFFSAANNLFKNGNYYTGEAEGAYTMWIPHSNIPVVYFQASTDYEYGYDMAFTFVHEFGHYYENIYNGGLELSYDHDETQSQGDEMLFLAWLKNHLPTGISDGFTAVELDELFDILSSIVMSCAVDEFEQAAYSGTYNGRAITGTYADLFTTILNSYDKDLGDWLSTDYWAYVVFDSAAYYISYAMSALPSVELYTIAANSGLNAARDAYFKLFTFSESSSVMQAYTYSKVLEYCGLGNPFEEDIFKQISNYVTNNIKTK